MKKQLLISGLLAIAIWIVLPGVGQAEMTSSGRDQAKKIYRQISSSAGGTTYYIRPDGGTCDQCTGSTDAAYPGAGENQPCAWSHPFWALDSTGQWRMAGGDTLVVRAGSYMMGFGAPNSGWCDAAFTWDCHLPPLPSGPDAAHPTRLLGVGWDTACRNPPELWGTQRPWQILNLIGSSNVVIDCFEITDHSGCVEEHSNPEVCCERDTYPYGDWASAGIVASDSSNVTLRNLNIHGLGSTGIRAGRLADWILENVRIAGNGWVGWDGDLPDGLDSNSGSLRFKKFVVEWNGCGETYPGLQPHNCWAQTAGGYGDGFGTGQTGGHWIFEDSIFRYNTSDGLDLLYAREPDSQIEVHGIQAYGNAGNQLKTCGNALIENSLLVGNCGFFSGKSFTYHVDNCRAAGNALSLSVRKGNTVSVVNSTIVGNGDCLVIFDCDDLSCDGSEKLTMVNNAFEGYQEFIDNTDQTCYIWFDQDNFYQTQLDYNMVFNTKPGPALGAHDKSSNPLFVNDNLDSFNGYLQAGSPAIDCGLPVGGLNGLIPGSDLTGAARPYGTGVDRGAYEYGGSAATLTILSPNGGESWQAATSHNITWTTTGAIADVNINYSTDSGGSWTLVVAGAANNGSYSWTLPFISSTTCLVRVSAAANAAIVDSSDVVFTIVIPAESVSTPSRPTGAASGLKIASYPFTTIGSTSNLGHAIQYKLDWDDGTDSGWLASGTASASHSWAANGTYNVRAMARCVTHTAIESLWSATHAIIISDSGTSGKYNSPAQQKILPEVIWAAATGGGTWMSEVQVTDLSGSSQVSVYYSTSAGRRGPFVLWNNGGGALRSQKYSNMLQTIDGLDSGVFTYYGTVGAVEFITQDAAHVLQVMARTSNGGNSKTFPGLSLHDANTADLTRALIITNLTSNSTYRSTVGMFNPTADAVTVEFKSFDANNAQIGTTITKTVNAYGFSAFFPFTDAGRPYPAYSYDNVIVRIQPTVGAGKILCFGASANNVTNDPASHIAVQNGAGHDNGPSSLQILPEAIWASATGGGTWMSQTQIVDMTGGSTVSVYFDYGAGNRRGPFTLWTGSGAGSKVKYANILGQIETIDTGFTYNGKVGTVEFQTQDGSHTIQVTARTLNGNYSKTFPGLNLTEAETADTSRIMLIQNFASNSTYRSTCGFFNPTADAVTVEFTLLIGSGAQIGTPFSKTFVGYDYQAFSPFIEAGVAYPANSFDNVILRVRPTSGSGQVVCFGASANNASNDPAAHLAVQGQ